MVKMFWGVLDPFSGGPKGPSGVRDARVHLEDLPFNTLSPVPFRK